MDEDLGSRKVDLESWSCREEGHMDRKLLRKQTAKIDQVVVANQVRGRKTPALVPILCLEFN